VNSASATIVLLATAALLQALTAPASAQENVAPVATIVGQGTFGHTAASSSSLPDKISSTPDLCQTDPEGDFEKNGDNFCAPVAVSNSLMWLAAHGFPALDQEGTGDKAAQFALVRELAAPEMMKTDPDRGTSPWLVVQGVNKYILQCGYTVETLEYQGFRKVGPDFDSGETAPSLSWIRKALRQPNSAVWLNIGWYKYDADRDVYLRKGGHWITLVGCDVDAQGHADPGALVVHNPSPKGGLSTHHDVIRAEALDSGTLVNSGTAPFDGLPRDAAGFYKITGEISGKPSAETIILDGAVALQISK